MCSTCVTFLTSHLYSECPTFPQILSVIVSIGKLTCESFRSLLLRIRSLDSMGFVSFFCRTCMYYVTGERAFILMISMEGEAEDGIEQYNNLVVSKVIKTIKIHHPEEK